MKTVKEVSILTGVSIRTLRYYDEIGLLKPTHLSEAGYRMYDNKAIERLQQIIFFKELEIPLHDIKEMLDDPVFDKEKMLQLQKTLLERKRDRLNGIIDLISDVMKGVNTMSFEAFNDEDTDKIFNHLMENMPEEEFRKIVNKYGDGDIEKCRNFFKENLKDEKANAELMKWYGGKEKAIDYMEEPIKDISEYQKDNDEAFRQLAKIKDKNNFEREKELVSKIADAYKGLFNLDNSRAILLDTAKAYVEDKKLQEAIDGVYGKGSTKYFGEAIMNYYGVK